MTTAAVSLRRDVICLLGSRDACRMARRAIIGIYAQVAVGYAREARKVVCHVTRRAIQGCRHMIGGFANSNTTVMALRAIVYIDTHVIEYRARKGHGVVARRTIFRCRYVIAELARTNHIVMA